jgi:hypothetical protein
MAVFQMKDEKGRSDKKHSRYGNGTVNSKAWTKMFNNRFKFDATADLAKSILEA